MAATKKLTTRRVRKGRASVWFYDLETRDWDQPLCACAQRDDGERVEFHGPDSFARMAEFQLLHGGIWWAHAGGIFDHLLMFRQENALPREVILTGSSVLKATGHKAANRPALAYRDSFPRWLSSLAKVGKAVGLEKLEADRGALEKMNGQDLLRYCRRDVEILAKGSLLEDAWLAQWDVGAHTSGTAAVKLLEALDPETWSVLARPDCAVDPALLHTEDDVGTPTADHEPEAPEYGALDAVRGGRVEHRVVGPVKGPIHVYDLHSSYPSQYTKGMLPVGCIPTDSTRLDKWGWVDMVTWDAPRTRRTAFELGQHNEGAGRLTAWTTWEVAAELEARGMNPRRHGVGFQAVTGVEGFGSRFVRELFRIKEGGGAESFFAKVTLNSLHGKFGENPHKTRYLARPGLTRLDPERSFLEHFDPVAADMRAAPYHQPITSATILARARLTLALGIEALETHGWKFFYCDTDSLHTDCPPEVFKRILDLGPDMGQWGHEFCAEEAIYLAPKTYCLRAGGKEKKAAKGFPRDLQWDRYYAAWKDSGLSVSRGGLAKLKQGGKMGTATALTRTLRPVTFGRLLNKDGSLSYE